MNGQLLAEAIQAAATIWRALLVWIVVLAAVGTVALLAGLAGTVWAWRAVRRACTPVSRLRSPSGGSTDVATLPEPSSGRTANPWTRADKEAA